MSTAEGSAARTRARWAQRCLDHVGRGPQDPLVELGWIVQAQHNVVESAAGFVEAARRDGCSWRQIGSALGISSQAARSAYKTRLERQERLREDLVWFPGGVPGKYATNAKKGMRRASTANDSVITGAGESEALHGVADEAGARGPRRGRAQAASEAPTGATDDRCGLPEGHPIWHPECRCPVGQEA